MVFILQLLGMAYCSCIKNTFSTHRDRKGSLQIYHQKQITSSAHDMFWRKC